MRTLPQLIGWMACLSLMGCHPHSCEIEPTICYQPQERQFRTLDSPFQVLSPQEFKEEWGKEMHIGMEFAKELDLYRAITAFKRSLFLLPYDKTDRRHQVQFYIFECYYLGKKYAEAIETFEASGLVSVSTTFPTFRELVIMLYDCYLQDEQAEKAEKILELIQKGDPKTADHLTQYTAFMSGNAFLPEYYCVEKSVRKAQALNALLPGAGYLYVGQKKSALTSFLINASFIAAACYFFEHKNYGAAAFTTSLELGWYFGGINGAGLEAKQWNEHHYNTLSKEYMIQEKLFPVLMFQTSF